MLSGDMPTSIMQGISIFLRGFWARDMKCLRGKVLKNRFDVWNMMNFGGWVTLQCGLVSFI